MAYRETPRMRARKAATRQNILESTNALVAEGGFGNASVARVAERAEVAIGSVYRHFDSKSDLFAEVFRNATEQEVSKVAEALSGEGNASTVLAESLRVFARRAIRAPTMAWALIAEPVDPVVEAERLRYRQAYAELFEQALERGIREGLFARQNARLSSAALVGAIAESLIGPLSPAAEDLTGDSANDLIEAIVRFCMNAVRPEGGSTP